MPTLAEFTANKIVELQAELVKVKAAISAAITGAEYEAEAGGQRRRLKRQSLDVLYARQAQLERELCQLQGFGGSRVNHGVPM
jgi:hypothetical protein